MLSNDLIKLSCLQQSDILEKDMASGLNEASTEVLRSLRETANSAVKEYDGYMLDRFYSFLQATPRSDEFDGSLKQVRKAMLKEVRAKLTAGMIDSSTAMTIMDDIDDSFGKSKIKCK